MKKTRIAVLISGGGTNLQALIDAQKNGQIKNGHIVCVVSSNPDAYGLIRAQNSGIPAYSISKKECSSQEEFESRIVSLLDSYEVDLIVLAGFMSILGSGFIEKYTDRIINVHPSLIPSFCGKGFYGLRVHQAALAYGVKVTGATVHYVNEIPDGGKIIAQKAVEIKDGDTPEILQKRVMQEAEWIILPSAVEMVSAEIRQNRKVE